MKQWGLYNFVCFLGYFSGDDTISIAPEEMGEPVKKKKKKSKIHGDEWLSEGQKKKIIFVQNYTSKICMAFCVADQWNFILNFFVACFYLIIFILLINEGLITGSDCRT